MEQFRKFVTKVVYHDFPGCKWEDRKYLWEIWDENKTPWQNFEEREAKLKARRALDTKVKNINKQHGNG